MTLSSYLRSRPKVLAILFSLLTLFGLTIFIPAVVGACLEPLFKGEPTCFDSRPKSRVWIWPISILVAGAWLYTTWLGIQVLSRRITITKSLVVNNKALDHRYLFTPVSKYNQFSGGTRPNELPIPTKLDDLIALQTHQRFEEILNHTNLGPVLGLLNKKPRLEDWWGIWLICTDESQGVGDFLAEYLRQKGFKVSPEFIKVGSGLDSKIAGKVQEDIEKEIEKLPQSNRPKIAIAVTSGTVPISMGSMAAAINLGLDILYFAPNGDAQLYRVDSKELELPRQL